MLTKHLQSGVIRLTAENEGDTEAIQAIAYQFDLAGLDFDSDLKRGEDFYDIPTPGKVMPTGTNQYLNVVTKLVESGAPSKLVENQCRILVESLEKPC